MSGYVVDASVAVKWLVAEPYSDKAVGLIDRGLPLVAPELTYVEAANALWAAARRGDISDEDVREAVDTLTDAPVTIPSTMKRLMPAASRLARDLGHPVYGCVYLALALQEQRPLITADRRFLRAVRSHPYLSDQVVSLESLA